MAREPERKDRPRPVEEETAGAAGQSFSAACLRYLKYRGRRPG